MGGNDDSKSRLGGWIDTRWAKGGPESVSGRNLAGAMLKMDRQPPTTFPGAAFRGLGPIGSSIINPRGPLYND
jgi:hypothetical protein